MNFNTREDIIRKTKKALAVGENGDSDVAFSASYEDTVKAFFDDSFSKEESWRIIDAIEDKMGNGYVSLIFAAKDNTEEMSKLISNAIEIMGGDPMPKAEDEEPKSEEEDGEKKEGEDAETDTSGNSSSDLGISVNTPNE